MNYQLLRETIGLIEEFDLHANDKLYTKDLTGFKRWIYDSEAKNTNVLNEPIWEGKENGRSAESVISTLLVHMNRYAKTYSKAAIYNSEFSTQEDFIYLITLKSFGEMTKIDLIKKNIQDKPTGIQIINRLVKKGWVSQGSSKLDKRSKVISITSKGLKVLDEQMDKIRLATKIVTGNLSHNEKMELIQLLSKLNDFHLPIFLQHMNSEDLLRKVNEDYSLLNN